MLSPNRTAIPELVTAAARERERVAQSRHLTPEGRAAVVARGVVGLVARAALDLRDYGEAWAEAVRERDRVFAQVRAALPTPEPAYVAQVWQMGRESPEFRSRITAATLTETPDAAALFLLAAVAAAPLAELVGLDALTYRQVVAALDAVAARDARVVAAQDRVETIAEQMATGARLLRESIRGLPAEELAPAAFAVPETLPEGVTSNARVFALAHHDGPLLADLGAAGGEQVYQALYGMAA